MKRSHTESIPPSFVSAYQVRVRPDGKEGAVREVEDAHHAVDQREPGRDQEVHRAQTEAGDEEKDRWCSSCVPHSEVPVYEGLVVEVGDDACVHDAPLVEHDDRARELADDAEVLLDQ